MRKSTLSATFVALLLAFFVCGCEEEKSDTENYDKNISTKVISKNSKKKISSIHKPFPKRLRFSRTNRLFR